MAKDALLLVHPGTGTIIDASDGVLAVKILGGVRDLDDDDIVSYALRHGTDVREMIGDE
jgi:hypothetical protein